MYLIMEITKKGRRYISTEDPYMKVEDAYEELFDLRVEYPTREFYLVVAVICPEDPEEREAAQMEIQRRKRGQNPRKRKKR